MMSAQPTPVNAKSYRLDRASIESVNGPPSPDGINIRISNATSLAEVVMSVAPTVASSQTARQMSRFEIGSTRWVSARATRP